MSISGIFIGLSIYFYFRAERLQRDLFSAKKESSHAKKENKYYIDSMAIIAKRHEDFVKHRLQIIKGSEILELETIEIITPLINNYAAIFIECSKGKGKLHPLRKNAMKTMAMRVLKSL